MMPRMFEMIPPVPQPRKFDVSSAVSLRKFAMLLLGTLNCPKLWNRFVPPPGLVPPVMLYWLCPVERLCGALIWVLRPEEVMGALWADASTEAFEKSIM